MPSKIIGGTCIDQKGNADFDCATVSSRKQVGFVSAPKTRARLIAADSWGGRIERVRRNAYGVTAINTKSNGGLDTATRHLCAFQRRVGRPPWGADIGLGEAA